MNITAQELKTIKKILKKHIPSSAEFYIFGSRADNSARANSDLDLLIKDKIQIPGHIMEYLKEEFEESNIPFKVDVIDSHRISEDFRKKILNKAIKI